MTNDGPSITGFAGIIMGTDNLPRMVAFYRDLLGLQTRTEKPHMVNFEWGAFRLTINLHSEVSGSSRDPDRVMVNFTVRDIAAACERLRRVGVRLSRPPEKEAWGGWVCTFQDPDGNTLQLLQLPDTE